MSPLGADVHASEDTTPFSSQISSPLPIASPLLRRSSSTAQKVPMLHEALVQQTMHIPHHSAHPLHNGAFPNLSTSASSTSSSSTSLNFSGNALQAQMHAQMQAQLHSGIGSRYPNGNSICHANGVSNQTVIHDNGDVSTSRLRSEHEASKLKDIDKAATLFHTLNDTECLTSVKSHMDLAKTAHSVRSLAKRLNRATIQLSLNSVLVITKARDNSLVYLTKEMVEWLLLTFPNMNVYVDKHLQNTYRFDAKGLVDEIPGAATKLRFWDKELIRSNAVPFDFVITLGGDGTVLHASTLFQNVVPPIISFSLGSLGFLTNFEFERFRDVLSLAATNGVKTDLRMRFSCRVHSANGDVVCEQQVLNELTVDRGPSPYVTMLELYGDDHLMTVAQADGLIIATPTGSTAYSLSAGGSLVHPEVSCICITPVCPHTLSFRPIMVPDSIKLTVKVPLRSRSTAWAAFDGRTRVKLDVGGYVTICASRYPFPTVKNETNEYFENVSRVLNWNNRKEQKSFKHLLSDKNKRICDEDEGGALDDGCCDDEDVWDIDYSDAE